MKQTPMTEPEKLDLQSHDAAGDKMAELLRLFPEVRTEGGKIDLDRLKLALGEAVDVGKERYGMNWPGQVNASRRFSLRALVHFVHVRRKASTFRQRTISSWRETI